MGCPLSFLRPPIHKYLQSATAEDVIMHILGLPTDIFNVYPATIKFKTYQARWQVGDIYVSGDARNNIPNTSPQLDFNETDYEDYLKEKWNRGL